MSDAPTRYRLSFSAGGGLLLQQAPIAAGLYRRLGAWRDVRSALQVDNLMQARTASSALRLGRELVQRLSELTDKELELVVEATGEERSQMMWVAVCRRYQVLGDFAEEVLRERFLLMAEEVLPEHFDAFLRGKAIWHPELDDLKESTRRELRKATFVMMREAGLVSNRGAITPTVLSSRVRNELARREPSDVRFFPTREAA